MKSPTPSLTQILANATPEKLGSLLAAVQQADIHNWQLDTASRIYFLRNFTIETIEPYLKYFLYKQRVQPQIAYGGYGVLQQEILDRDSTLHRFEPDIVVLALMMELFDSSFGRAGWSGAVAKRELESVLLSIMNSTSATVLVNSFLPPLYPRSGLLIGGGADDVENEVHDINAFLRSFVRNHAPRFVLSDWERMLRIVGSEDALDLRYWYLAKAPFKQAFLQLYARDIVRTSTLLKGNLKKCLVLDCDNTLWGGVVGEDGLDHIQLDPNEWPGKVYHEFQSGILDLIERGASVALCSRNNEADVWTVLDQHPHCLIKRSHLSGWRINWNGKAENLQSLAAELKLGLESFVFVDDDPRECELISRTLPEVSVLTVPAARHELPHLLFRDGLFDRLSATTAEDARRTTMYQQERKRGEHRNRFHELEDYLSSLQIVARIHPAVSAEIARIAQLTQRTNQFNLNAQRYTEQGIAQVLDSPKHAMFSLGVRDRFGDLGLIGVFLAENCGEVASIELYLMSCRALGRGLEQAFLVWCINRLEQQWDIKYWRAPYRATPKNGQIVDFLRTIGFAADITGDFRLNKRELSDYITRHIHVEED